jgi:hypothetical protein
MYLLLNADDAIGVIAVYIVIFIIGVVITRWIFGIPKIIEILLNIHKQLEKNNQQSAIHIKLLEKTMKNNGISDEEINDIYITHTKKK